MDGAGPWRVIAPPRGKLAELLWIPADVLLQTSISLVSLQGLFILISGGDAGLEFGGGEHLMSGRT